MSTDILGDAEFAPWCKTLRGDQVWRVPIAGGPSALEAWQLYREAHPESGLWPVLLAGNDQEIDQLTWRLDILAEDAPGIPTLDEAPPAPELFVGWLGDPAVDDYLNDVPRHLDKLVNDEAMIRERLLARPDEDAVRAIKVPQVTLALVPAAGGWEVPALLAWAGAETIGIDGPAHLAVLHLWHEVYGAELVSLGLDQLELLADRPPVDARGAFELAVQQYAYCPALMDNLVPAIGALAATLLGRHWYLDWR